MGASKSKAVENMKIEETKLELILKQLEFVAEKLNLANTRALLIGSRAAVVHIRLLRGIELENVNWDLIISAASLRTWILERADIRRIKLIRTSNENSDLSVY